MISEEDIFAELKLEKNPYLSEDEALNKWDSYSAVTKIFEKNGILPIATYKRYLLTVAYKYGRSLKNAEPNYQEIIVNGVLLKIPRLVAGFDPAKSPFDYYVKRWLVFFVRTEVKMLRKQYDQELCTLEDWGGIANIKQLSEFERDIAVENIRELCTEAGLTPAETKILLWIKVDGYSHAEVQAIMEKNHRSSVTRILGNAIEKLSNTYGTDIIDLV